MTRQKVWRAFLGALVVSLVGQLTLALLGAVLGLGEVDGPSAVTLLAAYVAYRELTEGGDDDS